MIVDFFYVPRFVYIFFVWCFLLSMCLEQAIYCLQRQKC